MRGGQVEEDTRTDRADGELGVQPADQAECLEVIERAVLGIRQDDRLVFVPGADPFAVAGKDVGIEVELGSQGLNGTCRNECGVGDVTPISRSSPIANPVAIWGSYEGETVHRAADSGHPRPG